MLGWKELLLRPGEGWSGLLGQAFSWGPDKLGHEFLPAADAEVPIESLHMLADGPDA